MDRIQVAGFRDAIDNLLANALSNYAAAMLLSIGDVAIKSAISDFWRYTRTLH